MSKRFGKKRQQRQQPPLTSFPSPPPSQSQPPPSPPPPTKSLYKLLNLHPREDEERSKYDDRAVIEAVHRNPNDAKSVYKFPAFFYNEYYPLEMAVMLGCSVEAVEALYEANPNAIKHTDEYGNTVLHRACLYKESLDVATFLVEKNPSSLKMKSNSGCTPLHYACYYGAALEVVRMLLERYPPALHMKDTYGRTPLKCAKESNASPEVIALLEKAEAAAASSSSSSSLVRPSPVIASISAADISSSTTPSGNRLVNDGEQKRSSKSSSSPPTVFALPKDLIHQEGGFEGALAAAMEGNRWLLINIQQDSDPSSRVLDRVVWGDETVQNLMREKFIFWQTTNNSQDGQSYVKRHNVKAFPHVVIMDPHNQSLMWRREGGTHDKLMTAWMFLDEVKDFFSRHSDKPSATSHYKRESKVETSPARQASQHAKTSASEFPPEVISGLADMGFSRERVVECLRKADGNPEAAVDFLLNDMVNSTDTEQDVPGSSAIPVVQNSPSADQVDVVTLTPSELAAVKAITSNMRDFDTFFASTGVTLTPQDQEAVRILAANLEDFHRSLESVRGLPGTLTSKPDHVKDYFQIFTSGFERTYVAALTLSSGAVKGQLMNSNRQMLAGVLDALGSVTSGSNIPFLGLIAIFTTLGTHVLQQQESNMLHVFQDFFSGKSRDEYLLTYRAAAEQICLHPDYLSSYSDASPDVGPLRAKVKTAIERVQKRLQRCHLLAIDNLQPIELKAMDDLSTLTECVLNLWTDRRDEYNTIKEGSNDEKADFVLEALNIDCTAASPGEQTSESGSVMHPTNPQPNTSIQPRYQGINRRNDSDGETVRQLLEQQARQNQELHEKMRLLEEENRVNRENQLRQNQKLQRLEKENKELAEQVALHLGDETTDVDVGGRGAQQMCLRSKQSKEKARTGASKKGETTAGFDASEVMDKVCGLEHELYKVAHVTKKTRFDVFVANRVMTVLEAKLLVHNILLRSSDNLQGKGHIKDHTSIAADSRGCFTLNGKKYQIGKFRGSSSSWKRDFQVKIDQDHNGAKSVKSWFEENGLGYRYELHHKVVIQGMFADELE